MLVRLSLAGLLLCFVPVDLPAQEAEPPDAVTTRWLPDPFPNTPPRVLDRRMTVEAGTEGRSPSVLLHVFDVEQDAVSLRSFTQPQHGRVRDNGDGTLAYIPAGEFVGADSFRFTLADARGATGSATMHVAVIKPSGRWSTTSFAGLQELPVARSPEADSPKPIGKTVVPRAVDWNGDGRMDVLAAAAGRVWLYRRMADAKTLTFAAPVPIQAGGQEVQVGQGRLALAWTDLDRDGKHDLVVVGEDRHVRWARQTGRQSDEPVLAPLQTLTARDGAEFLAADVRAEFADWNGDGWPDLLTGQFAGAVQVAYHTGDAKRPTWGEPVKSLDQDGRTIEGAYNLNVRCVDLNQDGVLDLVDSYNWGTINFRINAGSGSTPRLPQTGSFNVTGPCRSMSFQPVQSFPAENQPAPTEGKDARTGSPCYGAKVDLHALTDGPIVDFADFNGDQTIDLLVGGEIGGTVRIAWGESGQAYLREIASLVREHPHDLGPFLANEANQSARGRMQTLTAALYDYVTTFATPSQKLQIVAGLRELIAGFPQYFRHQRHDLQAQPGLPSLAAQLWLTMLVADYDNPATRRSLVEAAAIPGGYRQLIEELGLIYIDNANNPRGADAIYQWLRTVPREIYPGTGITANDWLGGGRAFLTRGHLKNTFNGSPVDRGEFGFGPDARRLLGERGSENQFMTVVHHEACHDLDAYVRRSSVLNRRWGQMLVDAGGPDMRANPETGWLSWELTKQHFKASGLWDGDDKSWDASWKRYWESERGADWNRFGFLRGNISWFYGATQESLATQGNQHWNSTEGRLEVAIDRWKRGFKSNLSEALFFLEIWSLGCDKMTFCENDNACRQVFRFAQLRRNAAGYLDRIDLGDRHYEFAIDADGRVTELLHVPER